MTTTPPEAPHEPAGAGPEGAPRPDDGPRVTAEEIRDLGRLRRTTQDKKVAGVAGGLARHLDIDPVILRVAFVVLAFFGGAGILVYGACWLLVPEDGAADAPVRLDERSRTVALALVGIVALLALLGDSWAGWGFPWPLLVIGVIVFVVVSARGQRSSAPTPPVATAPAPVGPPHYAAAVQRERSNPRRRGPALFWFTMAVVALALGVLGIADVAGLAVYDSAYPALALAIIGAALVVGAFLGRAGGLILAGVVALVATTGATAAREVDAGRIGETPRSAAAVHDEYSLVGGEVQLDLTEVADLAALDGRTIRLEVVFGQIEVLVPEELDVVVRADVEGGGETRLFGSEADGSDDAVHRLRQGGPEITIDAEVVFGEIIIDTDEEVVLR